MLRHLKHLVKSNLRHLVKYRALSQDKYSVLKWLLAAVLIIIPLYPKFPLFNFPGIYVAVRAEDFLIAVIGLFWLFYFLKSPKIFFQDRINQVILLFFAIGLVSVLSGIFLTHTVVPHVGVLHWARRIEYIFPFLAAALWIRRDFPWFFVEVLVVVSILVFLYALGQIHLGFPVISTQNYEFSKGLALQWVPGARLHSTFGGHYDLAAFLLITLPLFWAYIFTRKNLPDRIFIFWGIATSFWLLIASSSRVSIAAYFVGVGITLWIVHRRLFILPVFIVSLILIFIMGDLSQRYKYSFDSIMSKVPIFKENLMLIFKEKKEGFFVSPVYAETLVAPTRRSSTTPPPESAPVIEDRSTSIRLNVEWPRAMRSLLKNPLLGTGYSSITLATDSDYLRLLGETGILGFFSFLLILVRIGKKLVYFVSVVDKKVTDGQAFVAGSIGAFVGILINASFIDTFEASKVALVFWAAVGVAVSIVKNKDHARN